jgi:hypothetical protein
MLSSPSCATFSGASATLISIPRRAKGPRPVRGTLAFVCGIKGIALAWIAAARRNQSAWLEVTFD